MDQKKLIKQLKAGNEQAYEMLFKSYYTELVMHANRYLYDFESSREIIQDLFVHIFEKRHQLDINSSLKSYLFRSTQNRCINLINAQKIRNKYADHVKSRKYEKENLLEKDLEAAELEHNLLAAIGELPPKCRMIFKMNRFEGLSNGEIAERLELSKRTVETQITKALKILRERLKIYLAETMVLILLTGVFF